MRRARGRAAGKTPTPLVPAFSPDDRHRIRRQLIAAARSDDHLTGGALTGSAVAESEDQWSDIDLAFGVRADIAMAEVLSDWTARMYRDHDAVHHFDVPAGTWIYRVYLLANGLQVDLAFAPATDFGPRAPTFKLLFGTAVAPAKPTAPDADELIGLTWVYCLHVRTCIARGKVWQAEWMLSAARDSLLALACLRCGLPFKEGRGTDSLPEPVKSRLVGTFVRRPQPAELGRAFACLADAFVVELEEVAPELLQRLGPVIHRLRETVTALPGSERS